MKYNTEIVEYNLSDNERKMNKEITDLEIKIRGVQAQYDKLSRTKPKRLESIKEKEDKLKELDKQSRYYSQKRNELINQLYRKEIA